MVLFNARIWNMDVILKTKDPSLFKNIRQFDFYQGPLYLLDFGSLYQRDFELGGDLNTLAWRAAADPLLYFGTPQRWNFPCIWKFEEPWKAPAKRKWKKRRTQLSRKNEWIQPPMHRNWSLSRSLEIFFDFKIFWYFILFSFSNENFELIIFLRNANGIFKIDFIFSISIQIFFEEILKIKSKIYNFFFLKNFFLYFFFF